MAFGFAQVVIIEDACFSTLVSFRILICFPFVIYHRDSVTALLC